MRTYMVKEADLAGIGQNALCTMEIGTKFNHHGLCLEFTDGGVVMTEAQIITDVEAISLSVKVRGGENIRLLKDIPPRQIFEILNKYREEWKSGYTYTGVLYIPFTRPELGILVDPSALVLGMLDVSHYLLQVKYNDVVLLCDKCSVAPEVDKGPDRPLGEHIRFEKWERTHAEISVEHVTELPFGEPNTAMLGYHIYDTVGVCKDVEVRFDGGIVHDPLTIEQNHLLLHRAKRTQQTNYFHVDFNRYGGALPVGVAKSFRQKFNWTTAPDSYVVYTEMLHNVGAKNYV